MKYLSAFWGRFLGEVNFIGMASGLILIHSRLVGKRREKMTIGHHFEVQQYSVMTIDDVTFV